MLYGVDLVIFIYFKDELRQKQKISLFSHRIFPAFHKKFYHTLIKADDGIGKSLF